MNIQEYISSGILEAYALGELTSTEEQEVSENVQKYPEIKDELNKVELTLENLAFETAVSPALEVKTSVLQAIGIEEEEEKEEKVRAMPRRHLGMWRLAVAASVTIAAVSLVLAYNYYNKWKHTENELTSLIAQNERLAQDYNQVNQKLDKVESDFDILSDAGYRRVAMNGTDNAPQSKAFVYWNENTQDVYLNISSLDPLEQEKQYQLWAIVDGKPVDAGVFNSGEKHLLKMKNIEGASAFAVTVEPKGGSINPSLETMQVMGPVES
ncbi:anti-sigma factor [Fulvivirga maritima]|uniref:anti-sigma factor n=1 Tax=Fulvivirga maritima TaxID=2904247 RepID=UPI001F4529F9|nr:anti-sigma factor [Fulvivirga maritima]UII28563.1 anti-sigma factor [Fulvivirga maritima]